MSQTIERYGLRIGATYTGLELCLHINGLAYPAGHRTAQQPWNAAHAVALQHVALMSY